MIVHHELIGSADDGQTQAARGSEPLKRVLVGSIGNVSAIPCQKYIHFMRGGNSDVGCVHSGIGGKYA
jgi:hypothetical protein